MFMGEYSHAIDAKGRVIMPAKFREELGASCVVTRGLEGCLSVYTSEAWQALADKMKKLHTSKEKVRAFKRFRNWNLTGQDVSSFPQRSVITQA